jgi:hypothetical protein
VATSKDGDTKRQALRTAAWRDNYEDCGAASFEGCGSVDSEFEALRTAAWRCSFDDGGTVSSERCGSAHSEGLEFRRAGIAVLGESPAAGVADRGLTQALRHLVACGG